MDLRRLVAAHDEFLAKFGQHTEEAPESLDEHSPPQRWSPPPSVTQEPMGFKSYSMPRLEPPRFDGEHAQDWIGKIQRYYNHHYTPLDDRLYLTKYLFDHPASEWMAYWTVNNIGKSWDDFLLAVKERFDPDPYEGRLATLRKTSVDVIDGVDLSIALNQQPKVSEEVDVEGKLLAPGREDVVVIGNDTCTFSVRDELPCDVCPLGNLDETMDDANTIRSSDFFCGCPSSFGSGIDGGGFTSGGCKAIEGKFIVRWCS